MAWMTALPTWLLLGLSMAAALAGGMGRNYYCKHLITGMRSNYLLNGVTGAVCGVLLWALGGFGLPQASPFTLGLGAVFGLVTMAQGLAYAAALRIGPWSYTQVLVSLATILPAVSGALFWHERLGAAQAVGMVLLVGCFVLSVDERAGGAKSSSLKWLALCSAAFVGTGAIGILQKVHQSSVHRGELTGFLLAAFAVSAAGSLLLYLCAPRCAAPQTAPKSARAPWVAAALFLLIGAATAVNNQFNLYLSGVMPSAVFFPLVNGGGLVASAAAGVLLFGERLCRRQWVGLALGTASVLLLCM